MSPFESAPESSTNGLHARRYLDEVKTRRPDDLNMVCWRHSTGHAAPGLVWKRQRPGPLSASSTGPQPVQVHNIWIDSANVVKYKLADQAGRAEIARSSPRLLKAIGGHKHAKSDLAQMRRALELSELIDSAKAVMPQSGLTRAVFVDAGINGGRAQIGVVRVAMELNGEHVRADSHPATANNSTDAEQTAIEFAIGWAEPGDIIFSDNQTAVDQARRAYGDRVRWLPRGQNQAADRVANLRCKGRKRRGKRKKKANAG